MGPYFEYFENIYPVMMGPYEWQYIYIYIDLQFYQLICYVEQGNTHQDFHNIGTGNDEAIFPVAFWDWGL